jgi:carboxylesterase type B
MLGRRNKVGNRSRLKKLESLECLMLERIRAMKSIPMMAELKLVSLMCFVVITARGATLPQPVKIDSGMVTGIPATNPVVTAFKGIPFAEPPVGELRWKAPEPAAKWTGVLKADHFSPSCLQDIRDSGPRGNQEFDVRGEVSEDCLYLNVWTPAKSAAEKLPVMVWFYPGGFVQGSASVVAFDAEGLSSKGVVVVTMNYRLGMPGFLALPELDKESKQGTSGNYGLLDEIEALKWVSRNIAAFGGDPKQVTIFGQSAGGGSVQMLTVSPLAKGLFVRSIAESGTAFAQDPWLLRSPMYAKDKQEQENDSLNYLKKAGIDSAAKLRAMSSSEYKALPPGQFQMFVFGPILDGYVIPAPYGDIYAKGKQNDVPIVLGGTADENGVQLQRKTTVEAYEKWAQQQFGAMADELLKLYPAATDEAAAEAQNSASRDWARTSKFLWAESYAKSSRSKVYVYIWNHAPPGPNAARFGAFHMSEIPYVMGSLKNADRPYTQEDWKITDMMSQFWSNFAKTGDPNGKGLPVWASFNPDARVIMQLGDGTRMVPVTTTEARFDFFKRFFASQPVH